MISVTDVAPPALDPEGTAFLLVGIGGAAGDVLEQWAHQASRRRCRVQVCALAAAGPNDHLPLLAHLHSLSIGARVMVTGAEGDVLTVCSWLHEQGVVPEEISVFTFPADEIDDIPVFCVHCATTHRQPGAPGSQLTCPNCARSLEVHAHTSGYRGSYLASAPTAAAPAGGAR